MSKALTKAIDEVKTLAIVPTAQEKKDAMDSIGVSSKDMQLSSIQVMQGTSKLVGDDKFKVGDIVDMSLEEALGGVDKPLKVMPLKKYETIRTYDVTNNGFKFMREEPLIRGKNDKTLGEGVEDGVPVKRLETFTFVILLKSELEAGTATPRIIRFRSTGLTAGRAIAAHMFNQVQFWGKMPYQCQYVALSTRKEKKDTAVYAVIEASLKDKEDKLNAEQIEFSKMILSAANDNRYSFDEREDTSLDAATVQPAKQVVVGKEAMGSAEGVY